MSVPNQKIIIINRAPSNRRNFTQIDKDITMDAFNKLNYPEFKLWYYLCGNVNGYKIELSYVAVENQTGIKRSSYYDAFASLQSKGYLKIIQGNLYNFFEIPVRGADIPKPEVEPKESVPIEYDF